MESKKNGIVLIALIIIIVLAIGSTIFLISMISGGGNDVAKRTTDSYEQGILDYSFYEGKLTASVSGIKESVNKDDVLEITIPSVVKKDGKEYQVKSVNCKGTIDNTDFKKCKNLHTIIVSEGIEKLDEGIFAECKNLKKVVLSNSIEEIPFKAFAYDRELAEIHIPNNIKKIGESAFYYCEKLKSIILPNGLETISRAAFSNCFELKEITIPESVSNVGQAICMGCNIDFKIYVKGKKEKPESWDTYWSVRNNDSATVYWDK